MKIYKYDYEIDIFFYSIQNSTMDMNSNGSNIWKYHKIEIYSILIIICARS